MEKMNAVAKKLKLNRVIQDYVVKNDSTFKGTHRDGNILDEIFTNMDISYGGIRDNNISDHKIINYTLKSTKTYNAIVPLQKQ
jgi:hypothetical protein